MRFDEELFRLNKKRRGWLSRIYAPCRKTLLAVGGGCLMALILNPAPLAVAQEAASQGGGLEIGVEVKAGPSSGSPEAPPAATLTPPPPPPVSAPPPPPASPPPAPRAAAASAPPAHVLHDKAVSDMVASLEFSRQAALKDYSGGMTNENIFDPFMPAATVSSDPEANTLQTAIEERLPPLQRIELNQIRLVAVVVPESGGRTALVEDSTGIGYIVQVGTPIGRKNGRVVAIHGDRLEVEEKVKNFMGEDKSRIAEIRLYQGEGAR